MNATPPDADGALPIGWSAEDLGRAVRAARRGVGISLRELARRSRLSQTFLHALENGRTDISVGRLVRVAQALGLGLPELLEASLRIAPAGAARLVTEGERVPLASPIPGLELALLAPSLDNARTYVHGTLAAGAVAEPGAVVRGSETFVYLLSGATRVELAGGESLTLRPGDSVSYPSDVFERMVAAEEGPAAFLWAYAAVDG